MLNDYCLLEIFKHLSVIDLANFKENYENLGAIVDMEFLRKTSGSFFFGCRHRMDTALQIIRQFGSSITDLTINYHDYYEIEWSEIFSVIKEHCSGQLKALALCGDAVGRIKETDILLIADTLKNVETLELKNLNYELRTNYSQDFKNILSRCENARSIALISYIDIDVHPALFQKNKNLSKLKLHGLSNLEMIVDGLLNTRLEEFSVSSVKEKEKSFYENITQLFQLNHLKRLSIDCWYMDVGSFLCHVDASNSLNVLSLSNIHLDETNIAALGRMSRLKVLKLRYSCCHTTEMRFESVLVLCGNKNFEHLILMCYQEPINEDNFMKLIERRKASTAEKCLNLILMNMLYVQSVKEVPCELVEANRETIKLIDEDDATYEYYTLDRDEL